MASENQHLVLLAHCCLQRKDRSLPSGHAEHGVAAVVGQAQLLNHIGGLVTAAGGVKSQVSQRMHFAQQHHIRKLSQAAADDRASTAGPVVHHTNGRQLAAHRQFSGYQRCSASF